MERAELSDWLRLTLTPGVGNQTARKLLAAFGLPQAVFAQDAAALRQVVGEALAIALAREPGELEEQVEATWQWLSDPTDAASAKRILTWADPAYPAGLLQTEDPPMLLYLHGHRAILEDDADPRLADSLGRGIAIVGSRNPTPQGLHNARQFATALAGAGHTVVSGMALGIDGAAHEGALDALAKDGGRLATVAVVGTGLDRVYPRRHHELARRIASAGLLVSEFPIGTPPLAANFPRRNRIIAALSRGTLVVEAALQSGSLITARLAAEQGREVFAIPGSIHAPQSRGCHALIRQGAKLVESAQDVLEELDGPGAGAHSAAASPADGDTAEAADMPPGTDPALVQALGFDPVSLDVLQARTGIDTARLQAQLMALELDGQVARLPGQLFQRVATG